MNSGKHLTSRAISDEENLDKSYVRRLLSLAFLASDIVERILSGDHSATLTPERLRKSRPLPGKMERPASDGHRLDSLSTLKTARPRAELFLRRPGESHPASHSACIRAWTKNWALRDSTRKPAFRAKMSLRALSEIRVSAQATEIASGFGRLQRPGVRCEKNGGGCILMQTCLDWNTSNRENTGNSGKNSALRIVKASMLPLYSMICGATPCPTITGNIPPLSRIWIAGSAKRMHLNRKCRPCSKSVNLPVKNPV